MTFLSRLPALAAHLAPESSASLGRANGSSAHRHRMFYGLKKKEHKTVKNPDCFMINPCVSSHRFHILVLA